VSERLKVMLAGGHVEFLDLGTTTARGLEAQIEQRGVKTEWLPIEDGKGVIRVDAIVGMRVEGKPDPAGKAESDRLTRLDDERRLAGKPPTDEHILERRIR
jgi:hypothetical protein